MGFSFLIIIGVPIIGVIVVYSFKEKIREEFRKKENDLYKREHAKDLEILKEKSALSKEKQAFDEQCKRDIEFLEDQKDAFKKIVAEKTCGFPWLADKISMFNTAYLSSLEDYLKNKPNPAIKGAEAVKEAKGRAKEYERKYLIAQGLLDYYEFLVPWLTELREAPDEAIIQTTKEDKAYSADRAHDYLTALEWDNLSNQDKFQYALERYWSKNKSKWE